MKYGVIDVGSNSVRLMISEGARSLHKTVKTTRLAEGMGEDRLLTPAAIERTVLAVSFFVEKAKSECVDKIFVFATAAVRQAQNGNQFVLAVKDACGVEVDVVSGEEEAVLGYVGALTGADGGVIDVGGASAEVITVFDGQKIYSKSINIGAVKITDVCGQERSVAEKFVSENLKDFGDIPKSNYRAIGGTATSIAAMIQELEVYDATKVDGFVVEKEVLSSLVDKLYEMSVEQRKNLKGLQPERAKVINGGALVLLRLMEKIGLSQLVVSEKDNLEGYIIKKGGVCNE